MYSIAVIVRVYWELVFIRQSVVNKWCSALSHPQLPIINVTRVHQRQHVDICLFISLLITAMIITRRTPTLSITRLSNEYHRRAAFLPPVQQEVAVIASCPCATPPSTGSSTNLRRSPRMSAGSTCASISIVRLSIVAIVSGSTAIGTASIAPKKPSIRTRNTWPRRNTTMALVPCWTKRTANRACRFHRTSPTSKLDRLSVMLPRISWIAISIRTNSLCVNERRPPHPWPKRKSNISLWRHPFSLHLLSRAWSAKKRNAQKRVSFPRHRKESFLFILGLRQRSPLPS